MMQNEYAYIVHLLGWSLPVLLFQVGMLIHVYGRGAFRVLGAILPPALFVTAWLVAADALAIGIGIWRFGEGRHLGVYLFGVPLEEVLFFLITNLLVAFGLALFRELALRREERRVVR